MERRCCCSFNFSPLRFRWGRKTETGFLHYHNIGLRKKNKFGSSFTGGVANGVAILQGWTRGGQGVDKGWTWGGHGVDMGWGVANGVA